METSTSRLIKEDLYMIFENCGITNHNGGIDKEAWVNSIIEWCDGLDAEDYLYVWDFGANGDLKLEILKDSDYDRDVDSDKWNMVRIYTLQINSDGILELVDDTEDTYVTDGSLYRELERIWNYEDFGSYT